MFLLLLLSCLLVLGGNGVEGFENGAPKDVRSGAYKNNVFSNYPNGVYIDLNDDGLPDVVYSHDGFINEVYLNTGEGWQATPSYRLPERMFLSNWNNNDGFYSYVQRGDFIELNGDGLIDLVYSVRDFSGKSATFKKSYINTGSGWEYSPAFNVPGPYIRYLHYDSHDTWTGAQIGTFLDLNGDQLMDILWCNRDTSGQNVMNVNTSIMNKYGTGWMDNGEYRAGPYYVTWTDIYSDKLSMVTLARFDDLNGDSLYDLYYGYEDWSSYEYNAAGTYVNNGRGGWEYSKPFSPVVFTATWVGSVYNHQMSNAPRTRFVDIDNDGFTDLVFSTQDFSSLRLTISKVLINQNGQGFQRDDSWDVPVPIFAMNYDGHFFSSVPRMEFVHLNGDGLIDLLYSVNDHSGKIGTLYARYLNTGSGWAKTSSWGLPYSIFDTQMEHNQWSYQQRADFEDLQGNTLDDVIFSYADFTPTGFSLNHTSFNTGLTFH